MNIEDTILALAEQATPGPWEAEPMWKSVPRPFKVTANREPILVSVSPPNGHLIAALGTYGKAMAEVVRAARVIDDYLSANPNYLIDHRIDALRETVATLDSLQAGQR